MRVKFLDHINGKEDFKAQFCDMLDKLPFDIDGCILSGVNLYFNMYGKETRRKLVLTSGRDEVEYLTYGFGGKKPAKAKPAGGNHGKAGNIIPFRRAE